MLAFLTDVEVLESQTATLECEVSRPNQQAKWFKDGTPVEVTSGGRIRIVVEETKHRLVIKEAELQDSAQYSIDFGGNNSSTATLSVAGMYL